MTATAAEPVATTRTRTKPVASLSLDLDNKWSYQKTHGDAGWEKFPSYLDVVVPRTLQFLADRNLSITWFVVGQDAALPQNHDALSQLAPAGHEIGNHSFHHEPWLHLYSPNQVADELGRAEDAIAGATGVRPDGFRGPGFSVSQTVLEVLAARGYKYDASTFPTYLGPLARTYYFLTAKLPAEEKAKRKKLFGTVGDGLRPTSPYRWKLNGTAKSGGERESPAVAVARPLTLTLSPEAGERGQDSGMLLEIPVTTFPLCKVPIHVSYLLYLGRFSRAAAKAYWLSALTACRVAGVGPSLLLHPLDFLGSDDDPDLGFFPCMDRPAGWKLDLVSDILESFTARFDVRPMGEHAAALAAKSLPVRTPDFGA